MCELQISCRPCYFRLGNGVNGTLGRKTPEQSNSNRCCDVFMSGIIVNAESLRLACTNMWLKTMCRYYLKRFLPQPVLPTYCTSIDVVRFGNRIVDINFSS